MQGSRQDRAVQGPGSCTDHGNGFCNETPNPVVLRTMPVVTRSPVSPVGLGISRGVGVQEAGSSNHTSNNSDRWIGFGVLATVHYPLVEDPSGVGISPQLHRGSDGDVMRICLAFNGTLAHLAHGKGRPGRLRREDLPALLPVRMSSILPEPEEERQGGSRIGIE